ncbi:MAG: hypothetical protein AAF108_04995 [Planctomycetota bacterium]
MSGEPRASESVSADQPATPEDVERPASTALFGLGPIDLSGVAASKDAIHELIAHRGQMSLLDRVAWVDVAALRGIAIVEPDPGAFWIPGHFPGHPLMPGVLQVEAGAQLCCFLHNSRLGSMRKAAFIRLEDCVFRNPVTPNDTLYLLVDGEKFSTKRFIARVQGLLAPGTADERVSFEARITGMTIR